MQPQQVQLRDINKQNNINKTIINFSMQPQQVHLH